MLQHHQYPLFRLVVFLILGIVLGEHLKLSLDVSLIIWAIFVFAFFALEFVRSKSRRSLQMQSYVLFLQMISLGIVLVSAVQPINQPSHFSKIDDFVVYKALVNTELDEKNKTYQIEAKVIAVKADTDWTKASGKVLLSILKDSTKGIRFGYGDQILVYSQPHPTPSPTNPSSFDYQQYLRYQHIWHRDFAKSHQIAVVSNSEISFFKKLNQFSIRLRNEADALLGRYIPDPESYAVATALILGLKDELDNNIRDAYTSAGATHVLAVSGLHVGILILIINYLFGYLNKSRKGKYIFLAIVLATLTIYSLLTGLSPSVVRASLMFGTIQIGRTLGRNTNIYNNLALSALLILISDPYLLFSIGFQLSYTAVIGIVYLQPRFEKIWTPKYFLVRYFWQLLTVSIAAQLSTFPICLYYFHQFPTYFWLSGFVVVPAAGIIFGGGVLVMLLGYFWELGGNFFGIVLSYWIKIVNSLVYLIDTLPLSVLQNIRLTALEAWLLYAIVIALLMLFYHPKRLQIIFLALVVMIFGISRWVAYEQLRSQKRIVFYQIRKGFALSIQEGNSAVVFADSTSQADLHGQKYWLKNDFIANDVRDYEIHDLLALPDTSLKFVKIRAWEGGKILLWKDKLYLHWNKKIPFHPQIKNVEAVWISQNPFYTTKSLSEIDARYLIFDESNYQSNVSRWQKQLDSIPETKTVYLKEKAFIQYE